MNTKKNKKQRQYATTLSAKTHKQSFIDGLNFDKIGQELLEWWVYNSDKSPV